MKRAVCLGGAVLALCLALPRPAAANAADRTYIISKLNVLYVSNPNDKTASSKVDAAKVGRLRAEAKVVRAGGRLVWTEAEVLADGVPAGKFAATGIRVAFDPQAYLNERGGGDGRRR